MSCVKVDLQRTFTFRNSKQTYNGIPVIAANMDTTGTFEMAQVMSKVSGSVHYWCIFNYAVCIHGQVKDFVFWQHTLFTAIHKHYTVEEWKTFASNHPDCLEVKSNKHLCIIICWHSLSLSNDSDWLINKAKYVYLLHT